MVTGHINQSYRRSLVLVIAAMWAIPGPNQAEIRLAEVSREWGVAFRHHHGGGGDRLIVETMGTGLVSFDFDNDGDPDVLFIDGSPLPGYVGEEPKTRLFRNEGPGRFVDITHRSRIEPASYLQGGTAADFDGDGDLDLYLTALGPNELWSNNGDGTFSDVTAKAGVGDPLYGSSAAFADVDLDGDLDLYVANYVDFTLDSHRPCLSLKGREVYCHPGQYGGVPDTFYRNRGDGTFSEATADVGLRTAEDRAALGVVFGDLDNDGWPDLYVANDAEANHLFRNLGDGTFEEIAFLAGTAYSGRGNPEAGMGVDLGDVDGDGLADIVVTNFEFESNALYHNLGSGVFVDGRFQFNLAESSVSYLAFGVDLLDLDHDADLDLAIAYGHILDNAAEINPDSSFAQRNQILENTQEGRFKEVVGAGLRNDGASRGLISADFDGDGDLDLAINNSNGPAEVYENLTGTQEGSWIQLDLLEASSNRFAIGARLKIVGDKGIQVRERKTASSYQSQNDLTIHFGLAEISSVDSLTVAWPSGRRQRYLDLPANQFFLLMTDAD
jgi:hypothetical protein